MFITYGVCSGQNLVPNGDFEQYNNCPTQFGQLDTALYWMKPSLGTSDYFNACANGGNVDVPDNSFGYQNTHSGEGYSGICLFSATVNNYRENLEVQLLSPLIANTCYYFEMYVCSAEEINLATDTISVYFSDTLLYYNTFFNLPLVPQINSTTGFLSDTANWILISGNYTATGGESYLLIGNFNDNNNSDTIWINTVGSWGNAAYVYIDDVCLTTCGSSCFTAIEEQNQNNEITIYPNPVIDKLNIAINNNELSKIILYDVTCWKLMQQEFTNSVSLNTEQLAKGIYLYEVRNKNGVIKKGKVVKPACR